MTLNMTLTNESDSPITLDIEDDKYAHLYLQSQIKSRKNRKRKIEPNVPLRLTFTAYCPTSNAPTERNIDFIINDKRYAFFQFNLLGVESMLFFENYLGSLNIFL